MYDAKECTARAPTEYGHPRNVSFQVQILIHPQIHPRSPTGRGNSFRDYTVWVRIPLGVQTGRIHVSSGFFKSEEGARLNKALTDVAERYLAESLKVTDTPTSLLNASVAQLEAA